METETDWLTTVDFFKIFKKISYNNDTDTVVTICLIRLECNIRK